MGWGTPRKDIWPVEVLWDRYGVPSSCDQTDTLWKLYLPHPSDVGGNKAKSKWELLCKTTRHTFKLNKTCGTVPQIQSQLNNLVTKRPILAKFLIINRQKKLSQNKLSLLICFRKNCSLLVRYLQLKKMASETKNTIFFATMFILYSKRLVTVKTYWGRFIFT